MNQDINSISTQIADLNALAEFNAKVKLFFGGFHFGLSWGYRPHSRSFYSIQCSPKNARFTCPRIIPFLFLFLRNSDKILGTSRDFEM